MTPAEHVKAIEDAATDYARACSKVDVQGMTKEIIDAGLLNWEALQAAIRAGVDAAPAPTDVVAELEEVKTVCAQAYQVMGVLLSDAGRLDSPEAGKILDNLVEQRLRHTDVLPWPAQSERVGWQLVPYIPTEAMSEAGHESGADSLFAAWEIYRAMLEAAPKP